MVLLFLPIAHAITISPFELHDMNNGGKIYKSQIQAKKVTVIEAYFVGCPYCNENAPLVNALASKYSSNPKVQVLDVGVDKDDADYEEWIARHHPNHPVLKDSHKKLIKELGTTGYPSAYVIDASGNVYYESGGVWGPEEEDGLTHAIDELLSRP